ncbi:MAG: hypothetical protein IAA97_01740 [Spirochaetes bacterium]|uniref:Uncharacterized protein n=1 Tax=Candidatus Ornithospirochaeta stercoripullorum TaxID=2840899 RepID=A0A9D9DZH0_9SPIO|nr:hypothetical protein [Candidatus Ornithospirochaeta stercoripullorum]
MEYRIERKAREDRIPSEREYITSFSLNGNKFEIDFSMFSAHPVIADMTSHLYFNLSGEETVKNHLLSIDAESCVINNPDHTAREIIPVDDTIFDFRTPKKLGKAIDSPLLSFSHGLNNAFILTGSRNVVLSTSDMKLTGQADTDAVVIYSGGYLFPESSFVAIEFQEIPINSRRTVTEEAHRHIEFTLE